MQTFDAKDDNGGHTSLHYAAFGLAALSGQTETVIALLEKGANVNARDNQGRTPADLAEQLGNTEVLDLLKARGGKTTN